MTRIRMVMRQLARAACFCVAGMLSIAAQAQEAAPDETPDAMQEKFGQWQVRCTQIEDTGRSCQVSQSFFNARSGKRLLFIGLTLPKGQARLTVLAPLGVKLAQGVTVQLDDKEPVRIDYDICRPVGCAANMTLGDDLRSDLLSGRTLAVTYEREDQPLTLGIPLERFDAAFARLAALEEES